MKPLNEILSEIKQRVDAATPGPWYRIGEKCNEFYPDKEWHQWIALKPGFECSYIAKMENVSQDDIPNADFIAHARTDVPKLLKALELAIQSLEFYTNYDKETVRHMDTEFLKPERRAVIKPLNSFRKEYAPDDMHHPSQIYQDDLFTYGPKQKPGKMARSTIEQITKLLVEMRD